MLYVTTRGDRDAFTAHHTLLRDRASDGGYYVPRTPVRFTAEELVALRNQSFAECTAEILNRLFSTRLEAWDVEFCIGSEPVKLVSVSHKILIAQFWNTSHGNLDRLVRKLQSRMLGETGICEETTDWVRVAVRIALLFGIFGQLRRTGFAHEADLVDISVYTGDFSAPMAAWYARQMGLPVGTIVSSSQVDRPLWELLRHGVFQHGEVCSGENNPVIPPMSIERLVSAVLGREEAVRFACGEDFVLTEEQRSHLSEGVFPAVVSPKRAASVIKSVYRTGACMLHPESAVAYGGMQDYRAISGEIRPTLIMAESSPHSAADDVASALEISPRELRELLRNS